MGFILIYAMAASVVLMKHSYIITTLMLVTLGSLLIGKYRNFIIFHWLDCLISKHLVRALLVHEGCSLCRLCRLEQLKATAPELGTQQQKEKQFFIF